MSITTIQYNDMSHVTLSFNDGLGLKIKSPILYSQADMSDSNYSNIINTGGAVNLGSNFVAANDANQIVAAPRAPLKLTSKLRTTPSDGSNIDLKMFLAKPQVIAVGTLSSTDLPSTFGYLDCNSGLISDIGYSKLKGTMGVRFTTVITFQVNASRFQQGLYALAFLGNGGNSISTTAGLEWYKMHRYSITQVTTLPSVIIDLSCDTQVQLRIPYICAQDAWVPTQLASNPYGSPGVVFHYPIHPVESVAGSLTAGYTMLVHYEDVEVMGNTNPQMNRSFQEREMKDDTISGGLKLASTAVGALSRIPLLSSIATPLSWFLDASSMAAWAFGFSKPQQVDHLVRVQKEIMPYNANCDMHDGSTLLAFSGKNLVPPLPGVAGTDLDEMSIDYLKGISAYSNISIPWTSASAIGTLLATLNLSPDSWKSTINDTSNPIVSLTPVAFLGHCFSQYSGSLTFTFKFCRTEFHSGRVRIVYTPYEKFNSLTVPTAAELPYCETTIFDLRESSEITMNFPFVSNQPWRICGGQLDTYGFVRFYVHDKLICPDTVAQSIRIYISVKGGDDLQFAVPCAEAYQFQPIVPLTYQVLDFDVPLYPQAGETTNSDICSLATGTVGETKLSSNDLTLAELCVGESIHSVRSIVKRGGWVNLAQTGTTVNFVSQVKPSALAITTSAGGAVVTGIANFDPLNNWACCYSLSRGGIRIRGQGNNTTNNTTIYATHFYDQFGIATQNNFQDWFGVASLSLLQMFYDSCGMATFYGRKDFNGLNVTVPFYHHGHSRMNSAETYTTVRRVTADKWADRNYLRIFLAGTTADPLYLYRAGADDYSLHGFVSIPAMYSYPRP